MNDKKLKFYVKYEDLTSEEIKSGCISYERLTNYLFKSLVLCNEITKLYYTDVNGEYVEPVDYIGNTYDEETREFKEVYQYYIADFKSSYHCDIASKYFENELILQYVDILNLFILNIDHYGTAWDYVPTSVEYTTDYAESIQNRIFEDDKELQEILKLFEEKKEI